MMDFYQSQNYLLSNQPKKELEDTLLLSIWCFDLVQIQFPVILCLHQSFIHSLIHNL